MLELRLLYLIKILAIFAYSASAKSIETRAVPAPYVPCTTIDSLQAFSGAKDESRRWKDFNVEVDPGYSDDEIANMKEAMSLLQEVLPCVNFHMYENGEEPSGDYIHIVRGTDNGCNSAVGKNGNGRQDMNIQSPGCTGLNEVMHEMGHALGLMHEQSRFDRDDYVTIHYDNIEEKYKFAFDKEDPNQFDSFGVPYNTRSLMHYRDHDFSVNGEATITANDGGPVGSEGKLQDTDKEILKKMYKC